jgi:hypothetical protein
VITRNLGVAYDGTYNEMGEPLEEGAWWTGIGWILREVHLLSPSPLPSLSSSVPPGEKPTFLTVQRGKIRMNTPGL